MTERGDFSDEFSAIIGEFRNEQNDPIVTEIFTSVTEAEEALNRAGEARHSYIDEVLAQLNYDLEEADLLCNEVIVSGIIRPSDYIAGGDDARTDELIKEQFGEMSPLKVDALGPYYTVEQQQLVCGNFDVVEVSTGDTEDTTHKICINLNSSEDEDPTEGWFYAYPGVLSVLAPVEASYLKVNREILQKYPDIAAQLEQLPEDCGDEQEIFDALRKLTVTIDWSKYPYLSEDDRDELFSMIEAYITNRVVLDNTMYSLEVKGTIIGFDGDGKEVVRQLDSTKHINAYLGHIRLHHDADDGDISTYTPAFEAFAPTANRLGGANMLYLPIGSVEALQSSRNEDLFGQEMGHYENPTAVSDIEPVAADTEESTDNEREAIELKPEVYSNERTPSDDEQELEMVNVGIAELFEKTAQYSQKLYSTAEEANATIPKLQAIINEFFGKIPRERTPYMRAEGPGVISSEATYNTEGNQPVGENASGVLLQFDNVNMREGDVFTSKEGILVHDFRILVQAVQRIDDENADEDEPSGFVVCPYLIFRDMQQQKNINFAAGSFGVSMYSLTPTHHFVVEINADKTRLNLPAYERMKSIEDALHKIAQNLPDLKTLPWYLHDLNREIEASEPNEYRELADPTLLNKIGEDVGGDEFASQLTVDALGEILHGCPVEVTGPMYTTDGTRYDSTTIRGEVETVISVLPNVPTEEPMLVLELEDNTWYVPLTELKRFRY